MANAGERLGFTGGGLAFQSNQREPISRDAAERVFGVLPKGLEPFDALLNQQDSLVQNINEQTIYTLYAGREVRRFSMQLTELLVARSASWILARWAPIVVSREQNFVFVQKQVNIVAHAPLAPTTLPPEFSWKTWSYAASKESKGLMATAMLRALLDPRTRDTIIQDFLYGFAVSAVLTLQRDVIIETVREAYGRYIRQVAGDDKSPSKSPYQILEDDSTFFASMATDTKAFLQQMRSKLDTVQGEIMAMLWYQGDQYLSLVGPLEEAKDVEAWVRFQATDIDKSIVRARVVLSDPTGPRVIKGDASGFQYVCLPPLRFDGADPVFDPLRAPFTIGQYYIEQTVNHLAENFRGHLDIQLYNLPEDRHITMNPADAIRHSKVYDVLQNGDTKPYDPSHPTNGPCSPELVDFIEGQNRDEHRHPPQGFDATGRQQLDQWAAGPLAFWDFEVDSHAGRVPVRNQFLMTSWDDKEKHWFFPQVFGEFSRQFVPRDAIDMIARGILKHVKGVMSVNSTDETSIAILTAALTNLKNLIGENTTLDPAAIRAIQRAQADGRFQHDSQPWMDHFTDNVVTNGYGGLNLPVDGTALQGATPAVILSGYMTGPGLETLAATRNQAIEGFAEAATEASSVVKAFKGLSRTVGHWLLYSGFIHPRNSPSYLKQASGLSAYLANELGAERSVFVVQGGGGGGAGRRFVDIVDFTKALNGDLSVLKSAGGDIDVTKIATKQDGLAGLLSYFPQAAEELANLAPDARKAAITKINSELLGNQQLKDQTALRSFIASGAGATDLPSKISINAQVATLKKSVMAPAAAKWLRTPLTVREGLVATFKRNMMGGADAGGPIAWVSRADDHTVMDDLPPAAAAAGPFQAAQGPALGAVIGREMGRVHRALEEDNANALLATTRQMMQRLGTMRDPMHDRMRDMLNYDYDNDPVLKFLHLTVLLLPNDFRTMQALAKDNIPLPFDICYWRLSMSYNMRSIVFGVPGIMETNLSPAFVRTVPAPMSEQIHFINQQDSVVICKQRDGLNIVRNVAPAGYIGGVNTSFITDDEKNLSSSADPERRASIHVSLQPLTEQMVGVVHAFSDTVSPLIRNARDPSVPANNTWSGMRFFRHVNAASAYLWDQEARPRIGNIECLLMDKLINPVAYPGPHRRRGPDNSFSYDVDGSGPAGLVQQNQRRCADIWRGRVFAQFPKSENYLVRHVM